MPVMLNQVAVGNLMTWIIYQYIMKLSSIRKTTRCLMVSGIVWNRLAQMARQLRHIRRLESDSRCAAFQSDRSGSLIPSDSVWLHLAMS